MGELLFLQAAPPLQINNVVFIKQLFWTNYKNTIYPLDLFFLCFMKQLKINLWIKYRDS